MGEPPEVEELPDDRARPRSGGGSAAEWVLSVITERIASGEWTAESFPTIEQLVVQLRCGHGTVCKAMQLGKQRGVVDKVLVEQSGPFRRQLAWRPVAGMQPRLSLGEQLAAQIRTGSLTGPLPEIVLMARQQRVNQGAVRAAYAELVAQGLLRRVWLPDFTRRAWYVLDGRQPAWLPPGEGTKAVAIAADIARRLPRWMSSGSPGGCVRALPPPERLRKHYKTHWACVQTALGLLVARGLLKEVPGAGRSPSAYVPLRVQPAPGAGVASGIPAAARRASVNWRDPGRLAERTRRDDPSTHGPGLTPANDVEGPGSC